MIRDGLEATLVLLRHGQSVYLAEGRFQGRADSPLSPLGLREADLAAARLAARGRPPTLPIPLRPPVEIVHSPLARASQTAERVAAAIAATDAFAPRLRREPDIAEIAQGHWEGRLRSEIEADDSETLAGWRSRPLNINAPGGERVVDVAARVRRTLDRLVGNLAAASPPAVVEGPGNSTASRPSPISGYPGELAPDRPWSLVVGHDGVFKVLLLTLFDLPLERYWSFPFALCGITIVELRDGRPILRTHNSTEHLALADDQAPAESTARSISRAH